MSSPEKNSSNQQFDEPQVSSCQTDDNNNKVTDINDSMKKPSIDNEKLLTLQKSAVFNQALNLKQSKSCSGSQKNEENSQNIQKITKINDYYDQNQIELIKQQTNFLFNKRRLRPEFKLNNKKSSIDKEETMPKSELDDYSLEVSKDKNRLQLESSKLFKLQSIEKQKLIVNNSSSVNSFDIDFMDGLDEGHKSLIAKQQFNEKAKVKPCLREHEMLFMKDRFALMKVDYCLEQAVEAIQAMEVDISASQASIQTRFSKHFKVNPSQSHIGLVTESNIDRIDNDSILPSKKGSLLLHQDKIIQLTAGNNTQQDAVSRGQKKRSIDYFEEQLMDDEQYIQNQVKKFNQIQSTRQRTPIKNIKNNKNAKNNQSKLYLFNQSPKMRLNPSLDIIEQDELSPIPDLDALQQKNTILWNFSLDVPKERIETSPRNLHPVQSKPPQNALSDTCFYSKMSNSGIVLATNGGVCGPREVNQVTTTLNPNNAHQTSQCSLRSGAGSNSKIGSQDIEEINSLSLRSGLKEIDEKIVSKVLQSQGTNINDVVPFSNSKKQKSVMYGLEKKISPMRVAFERIQNELHDKPLRLNRAENSEKGKNVSSSPQPLDSFSKSGQSRTKVDDFDCNLLQKTPYDKRQLTKIRHYQAANSHNDQELLDTPQGISSSGLPDTIQKYEFISSEKAKVGQVSKFEIKASDNFFLKNRKQPVSRFNHLKKKTNVTNGQVSPESLSLVIMQKPQEHEPFQVKSPISTSRIQKSIQDDTTKNFDQQTSRNEGADNPDQTLQVINPSLSNSLSFSNNRLARYKTRCQIQKFNNSRVVKRSNIGVQLTDKVFERHKKTGSDSNNGDSEALSLNTDQLPQMHEFDEGQPNIISGKNIKLENQRVNQNIMIDRNTLFRNMEVRAGFSDQELPLSEKQMIFHDLEFEEVSHMSSINVSLQKKMLRTGSQGSKRPLKVISLKSKKQSDEVIQPIKSIVTSTKFSIATSDVKENQNMRLFNFGHKFSNVLDPISVTGYNTDRNENTTLGILQQAPTQKTDLFPIKPHFKYLNNMKDQINEQTRNQSKQDISQHKYQSLNQVQSPQNKLMHGYHQHSYQTKQRKSYSKQIRSSNLRLESEQKLQKRVKKQDNRKNRQTTQKITIQKIKSTKQQLQKYPSTNLLKYQETQLTTQHSSSINKFKNPPSAHSTTPNQAPSTRIANHHKLVQQYNTITNQYQTQLPHHTSTTQVTRESSCGQPWGGRRGARVADIQS